MDQAKQQKILARRLSREWQAEPMLGGWYTEEEIEATVKAIRSSLDPAVGFGFFCDEIVEFEQKFAEYIGTRYALSVTSAGTGLDVATWTFSVVPGTYQARLSVGEWSQSRPLEVRIEAYRGQSGRVLRTDTLYHTHRGPMMRAGGRWFSRRWTALDPTDDGQPLRLAGHAHSVDEWMTVMGEYAVPAQNFLTADTLGHIAIRSTGHFPLRVRNARGDRISDGTKSANDWKGFWPVSRYPQSTDPAQGYLASANQQPKDPQVDSAYFGSDWPAPFRWTTRPSEQPRRSFPTHTSGPDEHPNGPHTAYTVRPRSPPTVPPRCSD